MKIQVFLFLGFTLADKNFTESLKAYGIGAGLAVSADSAENAVSPEELSILSLMQFLVFIVVPND
jgi:hypothetical protein